MTHSEMAGYAKTTAAPVAVAEVLGVETPVALSVPAEDHEAARTFLTLLPPHAWEKDKAHATCMRCGAGFGFATRRSHCRRCGGVFCGRCCDGKMGFGADEAGGCYDGPSRLEKVCRGCVDAGVALVAATTPAPAAVAAADAEVAAARLRLAAAEARRAALVDGGRALAHGVGAHETVNVNKEGAAVWCCLDCDGWSCHRCRARNAPSVFTCSGCARPAHQGASATARARSIRRASRVDWYTGPGSEPWHASEASKRDLNIGAP